ncbi:MAG TPA: BON domain-containing protein [Polyangiaceae bacterium]|nr:BON domain-containing protein [Polyangiaceae bacterium]
MKHYLGPLVCALVAACSSNKPAESAYDTTSDTETKLVPASSDAPLDASSGASSDAVDAATDKPSPNVEPVHTADAPTSASDTTPAASAGASSKSPSSSAAPVAADNTKVNQRDSDGAAPTPMDQGNNTSDLKITQDIRKAVVGDGSLSFTAKNVKIITTNGKVTLRGPVNSAAEREKIAAFARKIAGAANVDNQLEVAK